jgi:hypothetical protein
VKSNSIDQPKLVLLMINSRFIKNRAGPRMLLRRESRWEPLKAHLTSEVSSTHMSSGSSRACLVDRPN